MTTNVEFTLNMFKQIASENANSNIFFSPFSISSALGLVLLGSRGNTSQQITQAFSLDNDVALEDIHGALKYLQRELVSIDEDKYLLHIANRMFVHKAYQLLESFQAESSFFYYTQTNYLDFESETDSSREFINRWVENETKDKIQDLLQPGILSRDTRLVMVNAIYFKGNWASKFAHRSTTTRQFFVSETKTEMVNMMHQAGNFQNAFIEELNSHVLKLPYANSSLSMLIILPRDTMGIYKVEQKLNAALVCKLANTMPHTNDQLSIYLPKFKLTEEYTLGKILSNLGIRDMFHPVDADLSGISGLRNLYVSHVVHKAFIDVNEDGSEAAAATAMVATVTSAVVYKDEFKADHPFIFYILDSKTGALLFQGRFMKPEPYIVGHNEL